MFSIFIKLVVFGGICSMHNAGLAKAEKHFDFEYVKTINMNETNDIFEYSIDVQPVNETAFKVNGESELKVELDDSWTMDIVVYHNEENKEEFETHMLKFPTKTICEFFKTTYKSHFYERVKESTNFPMPDQCPIVPAKFWIKDHIFNGERYKAFVKPGLWRIDSYVSKEGVTQGGVQVFGLVKERPE